ncbi:ABC-type transport auxiliary lipoprotein family protein [Thermaurantiacus tibetensis]|uniref:ABC-type transport auxiliary lipoprotein family protein n=1 Tax=Thermaurantiacus tibetensis TaxID=2759035 RepID=UPI00188E39BB|nr:ABC-type transport auxiliary lipoprotein family protein [Thermaurantiacus tibetensis]
MRHLLPLLLLAGCGPLVQVGAPAPPPAALLTLSATGPAASPAGLAPVAMGEALTLLGASAPASLQTTRIPVQVSETEVQYLKAAQWAEPPARLFVRLLADTLAGAGVAVVDRRVTGRAAPRLLGGELALFDVDVRGGSPRVRVRYDATLVGPDGLRQRRFERDARVTAVEPGEVSRALNAAANLVAADVAAWVQRAGG